MEDPDEAEVLRSMVISVSESVLGSLLSGKQVRKIAVKVASSDSVLFAWRQVGQKVETVDDVMNDLSTALPPDVEMMVLGQALTLPGLLSEESLMDLYEAGGIEDMIETSRLALEMRGAMSVLSFGASRSGLDGMSWLRFKTEAVMGGDRFVVEDSGYSTDIPEDSGLVGSTMSHMRRFVGRKS